MTTSISNGSVDDWVAQASYFSTSQLLNVALPKLFSSFSSAYLHKIQIIINELLIHDFITELPTELVEKRLFRYLDIQSLARARCVCHKWKEKVDAIALWKRACHRLGIIVTDEDENTWQMVWRQARTILDYLSDRIHPDKLKCIVDTWSMPPLRHVAYEHHEYVHLHDVPSLCYTDANGRIFVYKANKLNEWKKELDLQSPAFAPVVVKWLHQPSWQKPKRADGILAFGFRNGKVAVINAKYQRLFASRFKEILQHAASVSDVTYSFVNECTQLVASCAADHTIKLANCAVDNELYLHTIHTQDCTRVQLLGMQCGRIALAALVNHKIMVYEVRMVPTAAENPTGIEVLLLWNSSPVKEFQNGLCNHLTTWRGQFVFAFTETLECCGEWNMAVWSLDPNDLECGSLHVDAEQKCFRQIAAPMRHPNGLTGGVVMIGSQYLLVRDYCTTEANSNRALGMRVLQWCDNRHQFRPFFEWQTHERTQRAALGDNAVHLGYNWLDGFSKELLNKPLLCVEPDIAPGHTMSLVYVMEADLYELVHNNQDTTITVDLTTGLDL